MFALVSPPRESGILHGNNRRSPELPHNRVLVLTHHLAAAVNLVGAKTETPHLNSECTFLHTFHDEVLVSVKYAATEFPSSPAEQSFQHSNCSTEGVFFKYNLIEQHFTDCSICTRVSTPMHMPSVFMPVHVG
ncbi:hypothetical protein XU18_1338 [Perkinsela sp. CCAP 1560/4]|nr:hypothetical protein XU18_1338 [Perkinsela sp. CCAP 1560/4]|eukprot:KNH08008.1 hypothetical protein XU18_1338 [Perkinsela sp. CCAP 1560/4]